MFVKVTNGQVEKFPYSIGELRRDNPNTSFPRSIPDRTLSEYGVFPVTQADAPSYDSTTQKLGSYGQPTQKDGGWVTERPVLALTQAEIDAKTQKVSEKVREKRNNLLAETDWTQVADAPVDQTAWATYRQALRDITAQAGFPYEVTWPTKPE